MPLMVKRGNADERVFDVYRRDAIQLFAAEELPLRPGACRSGSC
jgi:hypothetical protein